MGINYTNNSGMGGLFVYANEITNYAFGSVFLVALSVVIFISLKEYSNQKAIVASTIITSVLGFFLATMGVVNTLLPVAYGFGSVVAVFWSWYDDTRG